MARKTIAFTDSAITSTTYVGTTPIALNRASAALTLAGITLTTPDIGTPSAGTLTNCTFPTLNQNTTGTAANLSGTPDLSIGTLGCGAITATSYDGVLAANILDKTANESITGHWEHLDTKGSASVSGILGIRDDTAQAEGVGGSITLGGKFTDGGSYTDGASIETYKENGTTGNSAFSLIFRTSPTGTTTRNTALTLDSSQNATFAGDIKANTNNYVLEGYTTGRSVLRTVYLQLEPGATPGTNLNITDLTDATHGYNAPTITDAVNLAKSGTEGSFSLSATGADLTFDLTEDIVGIVALTIVNPVWNSAEVEPYYIYPYSQSNVLHFSIRKAGSATILDWTTILDASDDIRIYVSFITST